MTKLLVTGAAGQLGQAVLHHLLETSKVAPADIVAASRDPNKLSAFAAKGSKAAPPISSTRTVSQRRLPASIAC